MTTQPSAEVIFRRFRAPLGYLPSGVLLHAEHGRRMPGWLNFGEHLNGQVLYRRASAPARAALGVLEVGEVSAAAAYRSWDGRNAWLALRFALHLAYRRRATDPHPVVPCATCAYRPRRLPTGVVRIPHLVAVDDDGHVDDRVVWEIMTADNAATWLGGPLPDQAWFEDRLSHLLGLRARLRTGRVGDGPAVSGLVGLLEDRYLSIRFAYQHPALVAEVLARPAGERRSA